MEPVRVLASVQGAPRPKENFFDMTFLISGFPASCARAQASAQFCTVNSTSVTLNRPTRILLSAIWFGIFLCVVAAIAMRIYKAADSDGWVPHTRTVSVWMSDGWLVGEFKPCFLTRDTLEAGGAKEVSLILTCGEHSMHEMNVEFHGSLASVEAHGEHTWWNCQRTVDSIICKTK